MASETRMTFQIVVAATRSGGIGARGCLPWRLPGDMKRFRDITTRTIDPEKENAVVMGRKTWDSLPEEYRPLPGRVNVVLSRSAPADAFPAGVLVARSLDDALDASSSAGAETTFVIGGAGVYAEALGSPRLDIVHLTRVESDADCDARIPPLDAERLRLVNSSPSYVEGGVEYAFQTYVARRVDAPEAPTKPLRETLKRLSSIFDTFFVNF